MTDPILSNPPPVDLQSLCNHAAALHQQGDLAQAERLYRQILGADPANFRALHLLGVIRFQQERHGEALDLIGAALKTSPRSFEAVANYGNVLKALGRFEEALARYDEALNLRPGIPELLNNRGVALQALRRFEEALAAYDRALAMRPYHAELLNNRGVALQSLRRFDEALACYRNALAANPHYNLAHFNMGSLLSESGRVAEGFACFTRAARATYERPGRQDVPVAPHKARHDREQREYLAQTRGDAPGGEPVFRPADGSRIAAPTVNPGNAADITAKWETSRPPIVVIDDFLTPAALAKLREFCLGSTVWKKVYDEGYLGAFPEHGFACPLLAQIADELRETFPAIFSTHPLRTAWGFKYESGLSGIKIHGDKAAVNVNFWITPDEANLDPQSGGLLVWDVAAPLDWEPATYNGNEAACRDYLARAGARPMTIPYRANRAVIFDSDLFHETDRIAFKDGYLNRRINVTLLYGRRELDDR